MAKFGDLPVETLSHAVSLLAPPFYSDINLPSSDLQPESESSEPEAGPSTSSASRYYPSLDPPPFSGSTIAYQISQVSKTCHVLLEASRPWLWESVDVQGGRGWLAIVNALTEEVVEDENGEGVKEDQRVSVPPTPVALQESTVPSSDSGLGLSGTPPHAAIHSFPVLSPTWTTPLTSSNLIEGLPNPPTTKSILTSPSPIIPQSKLRGRSRSPRRTIGFVDQGISSVLEKRSPQPSPTPIGLQRPPGLAWPRRPSFTAGRRTSLSNVNNREEDDEEEIEEHVKPQEVLGKRSIGFESSASGEAQRAADRIRILTPPKPEPPGLPPAEEEHWLNCNPELLPPPGPYIRHLSFVNFRTIGSRRTQDEAVRGRFVTGGRLEGVLKNAPNLVSLCMTEYVDSSLSSEVIEEVFFRGTKRPRARRRPSAQRGTSLSRVRSVSLGPSETPQTHDQLDPPRPVYVPYEHETEDQQWRRRAMFTPIEALDLTGCVSKAFQDGMREFWEHHYAPDEEVSEEDGGDRGRGRSRKRDAGAVSATETETEDEGHHHNRILKKDRSSSQRRTPTFPHLKRLSLRACFAIDSQILDAILPSFTALTHLDLSNTKVSSRFLAGLIEKCPRSLRLTSLSLARCPRLDPYIIVQCLCHSPAVADLRELNLFVNQTQGNPIRPDDLLRLITTAPCFKSGRLRYLDLSSAMFKPEHFAIGTFPPQPSLVSLGLSHIPLLPLQPIANFLRNQAPNVEILTLTGTAAEAALRPSSSALQLTIDLHSNLIGPLTTVPFSLADLNLDGNPGKLKNPGPSRLRVIELSSAIRNAIGPEGGSNEWKVIRSKGGRGWYVDVSAGWVQESSPDKEEGKKWTFARHLPASHTWRKWLMSLSQANGRVSSGVGWHSRKMEVVRGYGMLGREEGLAGAGAFAFEE